MSNKPTNKKLQGQAAEAEAYRNEMMNMLRERLPLLRLQEEHQRLSASLAENTVKEEVYMAELVSIRHRQEEAKEQMMAEQNSVKEQAPEGKTIAFNPEPIVVPEETI